jgi:hypothetical protein
MKKGRKVGMEETRERAQKNEVQVLLHSQLLVMPVRDLFLERPPGRIPKKKEVEGNLNSAFRSDLSGRRTSGRDSG